jgi:hypothetical protein
MWEAICQPTIIIGDGGEQLLSSLHSPDAHVGHQPLDCAAGRFDVVPAKSESNSHL